MRPADPNGSAQFNESAFLGTRSFFDFLFFYLPTVNTNSLNKIFHWNRPPLHVMAGPVPAIHVFHNSRAESKAWMPATGAGMTN